MMIENILAFVKPSQSEAGLFILPIIALVVGVFIWTLIIICLVRIARFFKSAGKEQKLVRMELGKLAEEVHLINQKITRDES